MTTRPELPRQPQTLPVQLERIPPALKELPRWVGWHWTFNQAKPGGHHGGWDKPPLNPRTGKLAATNNPATWGSYQEAVNIMTRQPLDGIGFNLFGLDNIVIHDLDNCRSPETHEINPHAMNIVRLVGGYWEISPSGTGIRGMCWGTKTGPRVEASKGAPVDGAQYDGSKGRYVTITGHTLPESTADVNAAHPGGIEAAYSLMFPSEGRKTTPASAPAPIELDDLALIAKAKAAKNGAAFARLWEGDYSEYPSQSEADLALCSHLAFWTGGDATRVDRLFRQSGLMRTKWDEMHGAATYGNTTAGKAVAGATDYYTGPAPSSWSRNGGTPSVIAEIQVIQDEPEHYTDLGLARRLVARHGQDLRYCGPWAKWLTWTGQRWAPDDTLQIAAWCKETIKGIYADAQIAYTAATEAAAQDDKAAQDAAKAKADALYAWAVKSEATARIEAAIHSARSEPGIPVTPDELDVSRSLFNVNNGTIELDTLELREHRREDLITRLAHTDHELTAEFPLWDEFLAAAVPDEGLRRFIQKAAGSCLTGDAPHDVLLFLYGPGGAGKGTLTGALLGVFGDYGTTVELETFTNNSNSHGPRPDLAALRGMRMVVIEEVDDRQTGVVAMLKKVSGGTPIATRSHYQETFTFISQFTTWLLGNKRPRFPDDDTGLWRRLRILPFTHVFANPDITIRTTLSTSAIARSRILNWCLDGHLLLRQEGLAQPSIVQQATGEYRSDLDPLNDWLADNTIALPTAWALFKDLYTDYKSWAVENGIRGILGSKTFSQRLGVRFISARPIHGGKRGFSGIGLKTGYQIRGDTSEVSPIGEVLVTPTIHLSSHEDGTQLSVTHPEVSPSEVSAPQDPWDEGWQDPEEAQP